MIRRHLSSSLTSRLKNFVNNLLGNTQSNDILRKAQAHAILSAAKNDLTHSAANVIPSEKMKTIQHIKIEDLTELTNKELLELAQVRFQGQGVEKDVRLAVEAWKEGTKREIPEAQYSYAACLRSGTGIEKNQVEALNILKRLADTHHNAFAHVS
jgi:TPR repeat protein